MENLDQPIQKDTRLSYSSASTLLGCESRWYNYKVLETKHDSDYVDNKQSFAIGKSFHHILEKTLHERPKLMSKLLDYCVQEEGLEEKNKAMVHAMVLKYCRLHKKSGLEVVSVEDEIGDDKVIGFVDAVMKDKKGNWWIVDLKTTAWLNKFLAGTLGLDRQLNLYAIYRKQIADTYGLDLKLFQGFRYRTTTKPKTAQRGMSYTEYVKHMLDYTVKSYDFVVPFNEGVSKEIFRQHIDLFNRTKQLRKSGKPKRNLDHCTSYFSTCPYWSQCYGKTFTELTNEMKVVAEE